MNQIVVGDDQFVAVGYAEIETPACRDERFARVWTSANGTSWTQVDVGQVRADFTNVVTYRGELFAFANAGGYCHGGNVADVWKSADALTWSEVASGVSSGHASWCSAIATPDALVASVGVSEGAGYEETWTSQDGSSWQRVSRGHDDPCFVSSLGDQVMSLVGYRGPLHASYLDDSVWKTGTTDSDFDSKPSITRFGDALLASTRSCCGLPGQDVGLVLTSTDGVSWTTATSPGRLALDAIGVMSNLVAAYSTDGATEVSGDGRNWFVGPAGPTLDLFGLESTAAAPQGLVIVAWVQADDASHSWFIPRRDFDVALAQATAIELAPMPQVGVSYPLTLSAACSAGSARANIGGHLFMPTQDDAYLGGITRQPDNGSVVLNNDETATYTTSAGKTVPLHLVDPPSDMAVCF